MSAPEDPGDAVHVGDIFRCSWGYDQTNVDYYTVTAASRAGRCRIQQIGTLLVEAKGSGCDMVGPDPAVRMGVPSGFKLPYFYDTGRWDPKVGRSVPTRECGLRMKCGSAHRVGVDDAAYQTATGWGH